MDMRKLWVHDTGFFSSERSPELQIADICAQILLRHHSNAGADKAYMQLRRRIVGIDGTEINMVHVDERSLHKDDPRNHTAVFDIEEYKRRADAIRAAKAPDRADKGPTE